MPYNRRYGIRRRTTGRNRRNRRVNGRFMMQRRRVFQPRGYRHPEVKSLLFSTVNAPLANNAVMYINYSILPQGIALGQRIGRKVCTNYFSFRAWFRLDPTIGIDNINWALVRRTESGGVPGGNLEVYETPGAASLQPDAVRTLANMDEYQILKRGRFVLSTGTIAQKALYFNWKGCREIVYEPADVLGTAFEKGCIFFMAWGTSAPATPTVVSIAARLGFIDS